MSEVIVSLKGGLGNQMFQYAAARALAKRRAASLVLDLAWFTEVLDVAGATIRSYALQPFHLSAQTRSIALPAIQSRRLIYRVLQRLGIPLSVQRAGVPFVTERAYSFDEQVLGLQAPVWLDGYWQSYKYFEDYADTIRTELGTPRDLNEESSSMLSRIQACDSVCIHVRRGDYVTSASASAVHGVCDLGYYEKGLAWAVSGMTAPHCFVFSDDPEWVRENMQFAAPATIVDVNGTDAPHQDLWLMAACQSFVIANSSLSWWGAWLGAREGKRVVAPVRWFKEGSMDTSDLIPSDWIRV